MLQRFLKPYPLLFLVAGACTLSGANSAMAVNEAESGTVLTIMAGLYTPGTQPLGIGEPLRAMRDVADEWEKLHPGVRVQFAVQPTLGTTDGEWIKTQLLGGIAPDIVHMNVEVVWEDIDKGWWVDLEPYLAEPNPYVPGNRQWWDLFANLPLTKAKRAPDGNLYTIVFDLIETGIYYNKDLITKHGLEMPRTWGEMRTFNAALRDAGLIPLILNNEQVSDWGVDIVLDMIYADVVPVIDIVKASAEQEEYLRGYLFAEEFCRLYKKGWFTRRDPRWYEVWRLLQEWRVDWQNDLIADDRVIYFLSKRAASYWEASGFLPRITNDPLVDFDWDIAYLPPLTAQDSRYATGREAAVIGGAGMQYSITSTATQNGREDLAVDFLRFMTEPKNAARIVNEAGQMICNIQGAPIREELEPYAEIIKRHYCLVKLLFTFDSRFQNEHRRWMQYFLEGGEPLDAFLKRIDGYLGEAVDRYIERADLDMSQPYDVPAPWELEASRS